METIPKIDTVLDPPTREDSENFDTKADDTMEKLPVWTGEINSMSDSMNILSEEINIAIQQAAISETSGGGIVWASGGSTRPFAVGETLIYSDGLSYRCLIATTAGESPDTNSEKWKGLILSGIKDDPNPELGGDLNGKEFKIANTNFGVTANGSTAVNQELDLSTGNTLQFAPTTDLTVTFINIPASGAVVWLVEMTGAGDYTTTWPVAVKWDGDAEPTWASGTDTSVAQFYTRDGGTTILGRILWEAVI